MNERIVEVVFLIVSIVSFVGLVAIISTIKKVKTQNKNDERYQKIVADSSVITYKAFELLVVGFGLLLTVLSIAGVEIKLIYIGSLLLLVNFCAEGIRLYMVKRYEKEM